MPTNWDLYDEMTTPVDADTALLHDVSETIVGKKMKKITWANIKATLKTYFDTLYLALVAPGTSGNVLTSNGTDWTSAAPSGGGGGEPIEGYLINGKITVTVASNNLTVAIKTLADSDPSGGDPVQIRIGNVIREITAALSVTKNAGTNWFNAGGSELATNEIDYFIYLGYNATDGITLGFSRIPYGRIYSDFSETSTNEKYCAISTITNAAAGDNYVNVGRFAATLSAGAGYTWTVPTFTAINLVQRPIYETRTLSYTSVPTPSGSMTFGTLTTVATYTIINSLVNVLIDITGTIGGSVGTTITCTLPIDMNTAAGRSAGYGYVADGTSVLAYVFPSTGSSPNAYGVRRYDGGNYSTGTDRGVRVSGFYKTA